MTRPRRELTGVMQMLLVAGSVSACVLSGCGGGAKASGATPAAAPAATPAAAPVAAAAQRRAVPMRGSANVIGLEEITESGASDAMQAVKLLRPSMLRGRNGTMKDNTGGAEMVVYVDGVRAGGPSALQSIAANTIREIRYISAADATTQYGTGHPLGAILVSTRR